MAEFFESRALRYEIHKLCDKRWQIAEVVEDARKAHIGHFGRTAFEELERGILGKANALLSGSGAVQAVRVLRERAREDGFTTSSEIFFREAGGKSEPPVGVSRYDGPVAPCSRPEDLYGREACKAIGVLLRAHLDKQFITALELLHFHPYIRKLNDNYSLVQGAVHQVATAQVKSAGGDLKSRSQALHGLIEAAERQARDALAESRLPAIDDGDFRRTAERLAARSEGAALRYNAAFVIARHFQGAQSFLAKLEFALEFLPASLPGELTSLLDELAAGCLDSSQLVMDLLGHQANLASALVALADLARGEGALGVAGALPKLLADGRLPVAADALWDRILRELARGRPLSRTDDKQEWTLLIKTSDRLLANCPAARKAAVTEHFKARQRRLRDAAGLRE